MFDKKHRHSSDLESKSNLKRMENSEDLSGKDYDSKSSSDKKSSGGGPSKTIGFSIKENSKDFNELNVRVETENDESANNIMYEDYDEADLNIDDENPNLTMKLDDNMSLADDNYEANELMKSTKLHASINQYKTRFLESVSLFY